MRSLERIIGTIAMMFVRPSVCLWSVWDGRAL